MSIISWGAPPDSLSREKTTSNRNKNWGLLQNWSLQPSGKRDSKRIVIGEGLKGLRGSISFRKHSTRKGGRGARR